LGAAYKKLVAVERAPEKKLVIYEVVVTTGGKELLGRGNDAKKF
jgi:hypothetical protein